MGDDFLTLDAHSDILNAVLRERALGRRNVIDQDWLPGMRQGGVDARLAAIYSGVEYVPELVLRRALDQVAALYEEIDESSELVLCTTVKDIKQAKQNGKIAFTLGMEGAEPLGRDPHLLRVFYTLGLRLLGLTHALRNYAAEPAIFAPEKAGKVGGLSAFGVTLVEEANRLGIVVDVSHLNEHSFWDVLEKTRSPIVASHSNARALYDHPRGLTDAQIKAIADNGGVIGINAVAVLVGGSADSTLDQLLDHLDHLVAVGGLEAVGLGPDFADYLMRYLSDEEKARFPYMGPVQGLAGDAEIPKIFERLKQRGYSDHAVELIAGKNFLRVFETVWGS